MSLSSQWIHNSPTSSTSPNPSASAPNSTADITTERNFILALRHWDLSQEISRWKNHPRVVRWEKPQKRHPSFTGFWSRWVPGSFPCTYFGSPPIWDFRAGYPGRFWDVLLCCWIQTVLKSFLNYMSAFFGGYTVKTQFFASLDTPLEFNIAPQKR